MDSSSDYSSSTTQLRPSLMTLVAGLGIKLPTPPPVKHVKGTNSLSIAIRPRGPSPLSPRRVQSPRPLSPKPLVRPASPKPIFGRTASPRVFQKSGRQTSPKPIGNRTGSPRVLSPRASSPGPMTPKVTRTVRAVSPRPRSPVVVSRTGFRPGSPKAQRIATSPRRSIPTKTEGVLKRPTTTAGKPKVGKTAGLVKTIKRVSFSGTVVSSKAAPAPHPIDSAPITAAPSAKELEASKAMVSPRIEFDTSRSQSPKPAFASAGRSILKGKKEAALNAMVTKIDSSSDPTDSNKPKSEMIIRKHLYQTFRGLKLARSLPVADPVQLQAKRVVLMKPPGKYRRKTALFDLDETLVHCLDRTETAVPDVVLPIRFPNGDIVHVGDM